MSSCLKGLRATLLALAVCGGAGFVGGGCAQQKPAAGKVQYRGPVEDVNRVRKGPVGADLMGAHGPGHGGNVLLRDGSVVTCPENDPLWIAASSKTGP